MASMKIEMDVDAETLLPMSTTFRMLYTTAGPDVDKTNPNQYLVSSRYLLSDINAPVVIEKPEGAIEVKQAMRKVIHQTDEDIAFTEQRDIVSNLRSALTAYYSAHHTYPSSLSELMGVERFSQKVVNIPDDRFTGKPFVYTRSETGDSYQLSYMLVVPKAMQNLSHVEGMNTATPQDLSVEESAKLDLDNDGLTGGEEKMHHTDPHNKDSDFDGFTDKEEIEKGYDPLVNLKTGKKYGPF